MKASDELRQLTSRGLEAFAEEGLGFFTRRIAQQEGVLAIGTDPSEWWEGYEGITGIFKAQSEAMQGMSIVGANPQAYVEGSVGWAATQAAIRMPDGSEFPIRLTIVYHQEDGEWKVVQWHGSVGVSNEENFGEDIPT
jgi:ketosteroid isomerase-like protein